ncbi:L-threonylcarbamoyladenylate synthase [Clostridiaceae bacterium M8S5]|nr:L-threonylcarbamoyladenylate synthase [Clostridiaceae bacterium M8S5]
MNTRILEINKENPQEEKLIEAGVTIRNGGLVAFPTETVYGIGANALDEKAVSGIFKAKGRPSDNPLILHIACIQQLKEITTNITKDAYKAIEEFWPGPLTLILKKSDIVPEITTAGLDTVAIRMPEHNIALEIIKKSGVPIAAPSANISGKPSPTTYDHVKEDLYGKVDVIVNGGDSGIGLESTVLDLTTDIPTILRPGGVTRDDLLEIFPKVNIDPVLIGAKTIPKSPGQKYKHYSPKAEVYVIEGILEDIPKVIIKLYEEYEAEGYKVGIMSTKQTEKYYQGKFTINVGNRSNPATIASNLFRVLREFDKRNADIILAESIDKSGIGVAIMNRLSKSAGGRTIIAKED